MRKPGTQKRGNTSVPMGHQDAPLARVHHVPDHEAEDHRGIQLTSRDGAHGKAPAGDLK